MLDLAGWTSDRPLYTKQLLEPAAGDGAFVLPAVRRLLDSLAGFRGPTPPQKIDDCISAFEIVPRVADELRKQVSSLLEERGYDRATSARLSSKWVRTGDFLLSANPERKFDVAVSNPPYVRAGRIPAPLLQRYGKAGLPKADMALLFTQAISGRVSDEGAIVILASDRWTSAVHGGAVTANILKTHRIALHIEIDGEFAFTSSVSAYPAIYLLRSKKHGPDSHGVRTKAQDLGGLGRIVASFSAAANEAAAKKANDGRTSIVDRPAPPVLDTGELWRRLERWPVLPEAGGTVRSGTALGLKSAFLVPGSKANLEPELLMPFFDTEDFLSTPYEGTRRHVIVTYDQRGLIDIKRYPRTASHLRRWKAELTRRACVRDESQWFRTIDRVDRDWVSREKLLIAGVSRTALIHLDKSGVVASNAIYSVASEEWPLAALRNYLLSGVLDLAVRVLGQRYAGGSYRYTAYVISKVRIPKWSNLSREDKLLLSGPASNPTIIRAWVCKQLGISLTRFAESCGTIS